MSLIFSLFYFIMLYGYFFLFYLFSINGFNFWCSLFILVRITASQIIQFFLSYVCALLLFLFFPLYSFTNFGIRLRLRLSLFGGHSL